MLDIFTSSTSLAVLFGIFGIGMLGSLLLQKNDEIANYWGNSFAILGSLWGLILAVIILISGNEINTHIQLSTFVQMSMSMHVDKLSAFFLLIISAVALFCSIYGIGYMKEYYKKYSIGAFGFFYNAFIFGMLLVVSASNGLLFMLAWEIMSLTSYFLVVFDRDNLQNTKSGYMYLIMTHVGATLILFALFLLYNYTGSFEFEVIKAQFADIPQYIQFTVIGLTLIGLGAKAGVIPMHIWLPAAHPAAPSHVSGLMSGVMIKTAIYMMIRLYLDILQPAPLWLGVTIVVVGAISALMGVLYALTEHDIKRLLAYSSIENIGIILLGLGSAIIFSSLGYENLMIVALTATLFHSFNHSIFKSLLFLSAGSIIQSTHTRNIEKYGGLIKFMPYTAVFFLVGSMAISALPPFNGFFSEWLTFQALFGGINIDNYYIVWVFVFGAGVLAITGGLAVACFVNAFGTTFLARPRSDNAKHAKESSPWMVIAMASLTISCFLIGLGSGQIIAKVKEVAQTASSESIIIASELNVNIITGPENGATISGPAIIMSGIVFMAVVWLAIRYGVNKNQKIRVESTWDCGTKLNGRMEITSSSFSQSIIRIFRNLLRPQVSDDIEYNNGNKYSVKSRTITSNVKDVYVTYLYSPIYNATLAMSIYIKSIQSGSVNLYVLYIFAILIITLMLGA